MELRRSQLQVADNTAVVLAANYVNGSVVLPPPPTLQTLMTANNLQLTWPDSSGSFLLQSADNLSGPWSNVALPIITNGSSATVTVQATNQQQFYRLVSQLFKQKKIMPIEISLVILNYQGEPWLGRCLESICAQTAAARLEVVVVDNLSTDKSREICESFRARLPHLQFIANMENLWFCEGNNVGAQAAGSPLLFFLNNDVWLEPDCAEHLLAAAAADVTAEVFASRVLDYANDRYQGFGALGFDWLGCGLGIPDHDHPRELFAAYGCAFVIRKKCFERVGGFPAELQAYTDEIDLSWRVWISGGRIVSQNAFCPSATASCFGSKTGGISCG